MAIEVVGRYSELAVLDSFLDGIDGVPRALCFEGEPGIGKTILWRTGVERARERGCLAPAAHPTESEAALPFLGLVDLLDAVRGDAVCRSFDRV